MTTKAAWVLIVSNKFWQVDTFANMESMNNNWLYPCSYVFSLIKWHHHQASYPGWKTHISLLSFLSFTTNIQSIIGFYRLNIYQVHADLFVSNVPFLHSTQYIATYKCLKLWLSLELKSKYLNKIYKALQPLFLVIPLPYTLKVLPWRTSFNSWDAWCLFSLNLCVSMRNIFPVLFM